MVNPFEENTTAWLSTAGSQIFFMQLGFLAYEAGFCKPVWTQSVILKNIQDTFVGVLTFVCVSYTLSESHHSLYGIISIPSNAFLFGIKSDLYDQILISAFFASTSATIISGAVLERMKNKAYVVWCLLIILINYSFISHWVWHPDGWLSKLGFVDGAGAIVVHSTAGMASLVPVWRLGARRESVGRNGKLLPIAPADKPIIHVMGAFILWYGWFAFNVSSPIAFSKGIGNAIGATALVTAISPICSACSAFIIMHYANSISLTFEGLLNCILAGLVAITGSCHTCNVWEAAFIGGFAPILYFKIAETVRYKWKFDDPLQVITIHLFCGMYSCITEGVVANDVYGTPGLIFGGYMHFGVQILGVAVICVFNFIVCIFLWDIVMEKWIFRKKDIRVSLLDIYLGTRIFDQNYGMALEELLKCKSNTGKIMLWQFHKYATNRYASEQLNFLIASKIFNSYLNAENVEKDPVKISKYILQIIDTYIEENGIQSVNISSMHRRILITIKKQLLLDYRDINNINNNNEHELEEKENMEFFMDITKEDVFSSVYAEVKRVVTPLFSQFLRDSWQKTKKHKFSVKIPFTLKDNWMLEWDKELIKQMDSMALSDTIPQYDISGLLLTKATDKDDSKTITNMHHSQISLQQIQQIQNTNTYNNQYPVIFKTKQ